MKLASAFNTGFMYCHLCSQPEGADLPDHNHLGSGVSHPGPRAGQGDVQPAKEAVWRHRGAAPRHEEILHHQCRLRAGCYQPVGVSGTDQVSAVRTHGKGGGEAHDRWPGVRKFAAINFSDVYISHHTHFFLYVRTHFYCKIHMHCIFSLNKLEIQYMLCSQRHHEQQGFLPTSKLDASPGHARDCHGGHGECVRWRQITGTYCRWGVHSESDFKTLLYADIVYSVVD